ncbi:MAG: SprB repeat-containing protein, partial [Bacteroidota bacterium]
MKKLFLIIFIISISQLSAYSQGWLWTSQFKGVENIDVEAICTDYDNSVYILTEFYGTIDVLGQNIISYGDKDILLTKLSKNNELLWVRHAGDVDIDDPKALSIDDDGNTYITGSFQSNSYFDSNVILDSKTLVCTDDKDAFLAKYDIDGNLIWTKNIGSGNNIQKGRSIALHSNGNISLLGLFKEEIKLGDPSSPTITLSANGFTDYWYAKFDNLGNYINSMHFKCSSNLSDINRINVDNSNNIYISGHFTDTIIIGTDTIVSNGQNDVIIIKFDNLGNIIWINNFGSELDDRTYNSTFDDNDNFYLSGYFQDTLFFGAEMLISNGGYDIFISKFDKNGNVLWATSSGGSSNDYSSDIFVDNDDVLLSGSFSGTIQINSDILTSSSTSNQDAFLGFYDGTTGVEKSAIQILSTSYVAEDRVSDIAVDNFGNIYMAGYFKSDFIYIGSDIIANTNSGKSDVYIAKYGCFDELFFTTKPVSCVDGMGIPIFFDGEATVTPSGGPGPFSYNWSNGGTTQTITNLGMGTFNVTVSDLTGCSVTGSVTVGQLPQLQSSIDYVNDVTCLGLSDGEAGIIAEFGVPPYSYIWSNGATTSSVTNLSSGIYGVTVTDQCGNISILSITINQPDAVTASIAAQTDVSCNGGSDGSATVTAGGGTAPYSYLWNDPAPA